MTSAIALRRTDRFSPNNVENDRLILQMVIDDLQRRLGITIPMIDEEQWCANPKNADLYLSMGRLPETLKLLTEKERNGALVVNSPEAVSLCSHRSLLDSLMRQWKIAMPPLKGSHGYWLKRGDCAAQDKEDVVYCADETALENEKRQFAQRGITDIVVSTHVVGDLIKFYGIGNLMFNYSYTNDGARSKFGNERLNGQAHHYPFDDVALRNEVSRLACLSNVQVYGGDAIVDKNGNYFIIDFNDWPTFANCREEAVEAIGKLISNEQF